MLIIGMNKITAHKKHCINVQYGHNKGVNMKTINIDTGIFETKYKDVSLEEYSKRWTSHFNDVAKLSLCCRDEAFDINYKKYNEIKRLGAEMIETAFNDIWEKQNS
jgi:hypothetical protein